MDKIEHLKRIKAKCEQLLEIADKRTQGKWYVTCMARVSSFDFSVPEVCQLLPELEKWTDGQRANGDYIASCAGPAEAGWRATIASVDFVLCFQASPKLAIVADDIVNELLAAWPEEIL